MKITNKNRALGFTLVELLVVIAIIAALAAMATPVIMKQQKKAAATTAVSNAKQVFLLMVEFDQDLGAFPNDATAASDTDLTGYTGEANDYLGQFIAGGYTSSEEIFYAKAGSNTAGAPDDNIKTKSDILKAGECGFGYIVNLSTSNNTGLPLMLAPMKDTTSFKPDPYDGKCVVLRIDGAVKQYRLKKTDQTANVGGGKTLFTTDVWQDTLSNIPQGAEVPKVVLPK
mgnify:CR=1 FL=1|jgi:prepilin-type N-terminal cleavage/methylation domain-containing protein